MSQNARLLLNAITDILADHPENIMVDSIRDDKGMLLTLHIDERDMSSMIGKGGKVINAMRTLVRQAGYKDEEMVALKLVGNDSELVTDTSITKEALDSMLDAVASGEPAGMPPIQLNADTETEEGS